MHPRLHLPDEARSSLSCLKAVRVSQNPSPNKYIDLLEFGRDSEKNATFCVMSCNLDKKLGAVLLELGLNRFHASKNAAGMMTALPSGATVTLYEAAVLASIIWGKNESMP